MKKQISLVLETPMQVCRGASVLYFNPPFFCFALFFEVSSTQLGGY